MPNKSPLIIISLIALFIVAACIIYISVSGSKITGSTSPNPSTSDNLGGMPEKLNPMTIAYLRDKVYPGSDLVMEETLPNGSNYSRYIVSYISEGYKIYALLTVPLGEKPSAGWPVVVFNHGFIPPTEYRTTEKYIAYTDAFSRNGYIVLKSDYRGHGNSEGAGTGGAYGSNGYTADVLNAVASIKKYKDANPSKIGMWGHSMGGFITLRSMVVSQDIKAGVIWGGVVASYPDLIFKWRRRSGMLSPFPTNSSRGGWRQGFIAQYGTPEENPEFWNSISTNSFLKDISGPLQLHHGTADASVPYEFSTLLKEQMEEVEKPVELFTYEGDDHNISGNLYTGLNRSVQFFDTHLKSNS